MGMNECPNCVLAERIRIVTWEFAVRRPFPGARTGRDSSAKSAHRQIFCQILGSPVVLLRSERHHVCAAVRMVKAPVCKWRQILRIRSSFLLLVSEAISVGRSRRPGHGPMRCRNGVVDGVGCCYGAAQPFPWNRRNPDDTLRLPAVP